VFRLKSDARHWAKKTGVEGKPGEVTVKRKVFVVEDQAAVREGIVEAVNREADLIVCGEADDLPAALSAIPVVAPELVLADLHLKSTSGLDLIRELRRSSPDLPIVAMTLFDPVGHERQSRAAGANGFVLKQDGAARLIAEIRQALQS